MVIAGAVLSKTNKPLFSYVKSSFPAASEDAELRLLAHPLVDHLELSLNK